MASAGPYASLHLVLDRYPRQHPTAINYGKLEIECYNESLFLLNTSGVVMMYVSYSLKPTIHHSLMESEICDKMWECPLVQFSFFVVVPEMTRKEHLTRQKQLLNKTLGLDGDIGLAGVSDELFKEEDLIIEPSSVQASSPQASDDYDIFFALDLYDVVIIIISRYF